MRPVFIGGCGRSGTTLLGAMLGTHTQCLTTPESKFIAAVYNVCMRENGKIDALTALNKIRERWDFKIWDMPLDSAAILEQKPWSSYAALITWMVQRYGCMKGKPNPTIWVDHTPENTVCATTYQQIFPDAKLIHLVRDGRAIASSVMKLDWGPNTVATAAEWWLRNVAFGLAAESFMDKEHVKQVKYEELVVRPDATLREICAFLQIDYQPEMISGTGFHVPQYTSGQHRLVGQKLEPQRLQAWQHELSPRQIEIFEGKAAHFLSGLGYELHYGARARPMTTVERFASRIWHQYQHRVVNKFRRRRRIHRSLAALLHSK